MKDPKALFPFLFATSWLGNLLLTVLAFYLAFTHDGPLTPLVFLTVAVCILAGNLLPVSVYLVLVYWRQAELKAETREASVLLRDSLVRSEEVLDRLDEAEGALSKAILVARQVPERIRESFEPLDGLATRLESLELVNFAETLSGQSQRLEELGKAFSAGPEGYSELQAGFREIRKELKGLPGSVEKLLGQLAESRSNSDDDMDSTVGERLDLLFEAFESVQDSLESLLHRVVELKIAATPPPFPTDPEVSPPARPEEPVHGNPDLPDSIPAELETAPEETVDTVEDSLEEPESSEPEESTDDPDWDVEVIDESEASEDLAAEEPPVEVPKKKKASSRKAAEANQPEMMLDADAEPDADPVSSDGRTRVVAHAMIGMYNKLFIRGDEPWLSWDQGQQMELIGIGEFSWTVDSLKESIEITVLLNDELPAEEGKVRLEPGQTVRISPRFPK